MALERGTARPDVANVDAHVVARSDATGVARSASPLELQRLLWLLAAATFLIFFQAFMIAPLIPRLAAVFGVSPDLVGLAVPAYLIPYGAMTLVWGPLSDRVGRGTVILGSLVAFVGLTAVTATAAGATAFLAWRLVTAIGASGVVPISLALLGDLFEYRNRGRALGWLFGAMAGGTAFGSSAGALLEPVIGWQGLFVGVALMSVAVLALLYRRRHLLGGRRTAMRRSVRGVAAGYLSLLARARGRRTYGYVLINAVLHSGIYTWLGLYFSRRYGLDEVGIGLAILAYGVPGFLLGPAIGRLADRRGRARLIPLGLLVGAAAALLLAAPLPVVAAALTVGLLSLGYDLTQPLLAGIVTDLGGGRGQAMGLNVFVLFVGFGLGSLVFQGGLALAGFTATLLAFGVGAAVAAVAAQRLFAEEDHRRVTPDVRTGRHR
jgi:predicted MFS family arabinose efflux permease